MDLQRLERELKKRLPYPYSWGRKQNNNWDSLTNFIYKTYSFSKLLEKVELLDEGIKNYALNRWFNFWSAKGVEYVFASHENVRANTNQYDKLVDFSINNIDFDHKTSVFPRGFGRDVNYARENERELIEWLYKNQSSQGRQHFKNRLFVVLYDKNNQHWKMKAEIGLLKQKIDDYVINFNENKLKKFDFNQGEVYSDVIWITQ